MVARDKFSSLISILNFEDSPHVNIRNIKERTVRNVSAKEAQVLVERKIAI
jgi:hypothetical protein